MEPFIDPFFDFKLVFRSEKGQNLSNKEPWVYFIFEHGEKKKFFFWKISRPRFRPKFWKCHILLAARILQLSTWNFFERHFYTQMNVLSTWRACSRDIGSFWESLVRYMADWLYGGVRIWRTILGDFWYFLPFFGDFLGIFLKISNFYEKSPYYAEKPPNPPCIQSAI